MSVTSAESYFRRLDGFPDRALFDGLVHVWEAVGRLEGYLRETLAAARAPEAGPEDLRGLRVEEGMVASEGLFVARRTVRLARMGLLVEEGVRIEPGVVVKGPSKLCAGAELRHGAYLRGSCLVGPGAVVGHATEVKNSAFLNKAEAGHFAYVGDSLLGDHCNLGAGTKLANLQLRSAEEKATRSVKTIAIRCGAERLDTGLRKLGAVVGDDVEIGCNTVTSPGALIGPGCWVTPNTTVPKGVYPPEHLIRAAGERPEAQPLRR